MCQTALHPLCMQTERTSRSSLYLTHAQLGYAFSVRGRKDDCCSDMASVCRPKAAAVKTGLAGFFANCPENAFQRVPQGYKAFTPLQRSGAVIRNGAKLLGVGFGASLIGVSITNALIFLRQQIDPSWAPQNAPQVWPCLPFSSPPSAYTAPTACCLRSCLNLACAEVHAGKYCVLGCEATTRFSLVMHPEGLRLFWVHRM